jgi:hypothetical protein
MTRSHPQWPWSVVLSIIVAALLRAAPAQQRRTVFDEVEVSDDIARLERLASEPGYAEAAIPEGYSPKDLRSRAYLRLGALGSAGSIAALRRVEARARGWSLVPPIVSLDANPHPSGHFSDSNRRPFAQVRSPDGVIFSLIELRRLGGVDAFLTMSRTPDDPSSWSRPLLVPNRSTAGIVDPELTLIGDGQLRLEFAVPTAADTNVHLRHFGPQPPSSQKPAEGRQVWLISTAVVTRDTDGDGWTDLEEGRLGLNPRDPDSDHDGIPDGKDVCPGYAASPLEAADVEAAMIQRVFFAAYGLHASPDVLLVSGSSRPVQLWGSRGPVLFGVDRSEWLRNWLDAPPLLSWKVKSMTSDGGAETAVVEFSDYEGALAAAGYTATFRRLDGEWFVVKITRNWIS